ncbi:OmpA family protein [Sporosarcina sp. FSL W7-1349]|uniref:OmpA family protein n=1 Tax=Sporosarcina sp. FSL W7-1349 TaxID=2921561 RepID=UPI0030F9AAAE
MKMWKTIGIGLLLVFIAAGCSAQEDAAAKDEEQAEEPQFTPGEFKPGNFSPGNFSPGEFNPGEFNPGNFSPGTFKPGTFNPGNFHPNVQVKVKEEEITVEVPSDLLFDFDQSDLKSKVTGILDQVSVELNEYEGARVFIAGHTDSQGEDNYNQTLSEERAANVANYLSGLVNTEHVQFEVAGYGQTKPVASNDTEEGRAQNRRVEIVVEPLEQK